MPILQHLIYLCILIDIYTFLSAKCKTRLSGLSGHLDLIVLKLFDLAQVCHRIKTCVDLETDIKIDIPSTLHIELKVEWYF